MRGIFVDMELCQVTVNLNHNSEVITVKPVSYTNFCNLKSTDALKYDNYKPACFTIHGTKACILKLLSHKTLTLVIRYDKY